MREEFKRKNNQKDELINLIIECEWAMFDKVHNAGGRAGCQDDSWTFYVMRYSMLNAFSRQTLLSYAQDLKLALEEGRNLLTEKYAYMMEYTDKEYFDSSLKMHIPQVSAEKAELVNGIADVLLQYERAFEQAYPIFSSRGRRLTGAEAGDVSFHLYTVGELKTYSEATLKLYLQDLHEMAKRGENVSFLIHNTTAEFYGYAGLDDAEAKLRNQQ